MSQLVTAKDLNRLIDSKLRDRRAAFETILTMCMNKVKRYAHRRLYRCLFEVPEVILGEPLYKLPNAIAFVAKHLKDDCGFYVRLFVPRLLYVSWDMDEISGKKVMQPMTNRAILPSSERERKPEFHPSMIKQNDLLLPPPLPSPLPLPVASRPRARTTNAGEDKEKGDGKARFAGCKPSGKFILNLS